MSVLIISVLLFVCANVGVCQDGAALGVNAPDLEALRGLDLAALAELQESLAGGGSSSRLAAQRRILLDDACSSTPDSLTNLLVYQYLMGSLPGGGGAGPDGSPLGRSGTQSSAALQALLGERVESALTSTRVTVSTSLTTTAVVMEPTTRFITSSTTYTTTVTTVDTKVIPVIFRGSKVTTTFSESSTEVIVATELLTSSTVLSPTIIQTLPVHITLTATSTKGFDGRFTLLDLVPGPSSVVNQPIATATVDLDATGILPANLDLTNMDLSQYDLSSLNGAFGVSDQGQVVSALTALLQQYGIEPPKQVSSKVSSSSRRTSNRGQNYEDDIFVDQEEPPKFNVIKGFTLSDRPAPRTGPRRGGGSTGGGSAATQTRYSKYHKKPSPENNGIGRKSNESDRESERYSASTRRRTVSQATGRSVDGKRANKSPSNRFVPSQESQYYEDTRADRNRGAGKRNNRNVESATSRRRGSLTQDIENEHKKVNNVEESTSFKDRFLTRQRFTSRGRQQTSVEKFVAENQYDENAQTTVLTMFVSGSAPGDFSKVVKTVTLRGQQTNSRSKREATISHSPVTNNQVTVTRTSPQGASSSIAKSANLRQFTPEDIVKILKTLDKSVVKEMLKSLNKWVKYYTAELIESPSSFSSDKVPNLQPSLRSSTSESLVNMEATSLLPNEIFTSSQTQDLCTALPITITETVYHTVTVS